MHTWSCSKIILYIISLYYLLVIENNDDGYQQFCTTTYHNNRLNYRFVNCSFYCCCDYFERKGINWPFHDMVSTSGNLLRSKYCGTILNNKNTKRLYDHMMVFANAKTKPKTSHNDPPLTYVLRLVTTVRDATINHVFKHSNRYALKPIGFNNSMKEWTFGPVIVASSTTWHKVK